MPIAEIFTAAKLLECGFQGLLGNRVDSGAVALAISAARKLTAPDVPENHHVLKAMHLAFVKSLQQMAKACDSIGGTAADNFSRKALQDFATSRKLAKLELQLPNLPFETLDRQVRAIYGQQGKTPKQAATQIALDAIETAIGQALTKPHRKVFFEGQGRYLPWADLFEVFISEDVKNNTPVYRILTLNRQNELVTLAAEHGELLVEIVQELGEFREETVDSLADLHRKMDVLIKQVGQSSPQQVAPLAETLTALVESKVPSDVAIARQAVEDNPIAAADALMAEAQIDKLRSAERLRQAARLYAPFAPSKAMGAYREAVDLDPQDVWAWIELGRLRLVYEGIESARESVDVALQYVREERDKAVMEHEVGNIEITLGNLTEARSRFAAFEAIMERLTKCEPGNAEWQRDLSISYNKLGDIAVAEGDLGAARERFEAGLAIAETLAKSEPGKAQRQRDLSFSYNRLGDIAVEAGDLGAARERFEAALAIAETLAKREPNAQRQRDLSISYERLGNIAVAEGDLGAARERFEAALAIAETLAKSEPGNAQWQRDLFVSHARLAELAEADGDPQRALAAFQKAEAIMAELVSNYSGIPGFRRDLEEVRRDIARLIGA